MKMKPAMKSSGVVKRAVPITNVMHQAKTWIVDGITTIAVAAAKKTSVTVGRPVANMWCAQTPKPMKTTSSSAIATSGNATIRRCVNAGMIVGRDPEGGDDQDVDLGVAEDPEEVLPEQRRAAVRDVEEVRADVAVEEEEDRVGRQRRQREQQAERRRRATRSRRAASG